MDMSRISGCKTADLEIRAVGRKVSWWWNVDILLTIFRLLTIQCKRKFTEGYTLCTPQRKYPMSQPVPYQPNSAPPKNAYKGPPNDDL